MRATLTLTLETPFLPGSADPNKVDPDWPLRPSEVKGIWRWWARALVAGALFDMGLLHGVGVQGDSRRYAVKVPKKDEAMCISKVVGKELGLGYAGSDGSQASCFKILIDPPNATLNNTHKEYHNSNRKLNRIKLLSLDKEKVPSIIQPPLTVNLTITTRNRKVCDLPDDRIKASIMALALAIKLQCFGKGSRRGLGCFSVSAQGDYADLFNKPPEDLIKESIDVINKIVKEKHPQHCSNLEKRELSQCELPPMPTLSVNTNINYINCIDKELPESNNTLNKLTPYVLIKVEGEDLLNILHNFFLRSTRAYTLRGHVRAEDDLRAKLSAWILGLPRGQKRTGYMFKSANISRRASPIIVAVHKKEAYISIFTSADWPLELTWRGRKRSTDIRIDKKEIIKAMAIAINELTEYLNKNKRSIRWSSWP